jgi:drug/metabolite transporter (DMT)-like permease
LFSTLLGWLLLGERPTLPGLAGVKGQRQPRPVAMRIPEGN